MNKKTNKLSPDQFSHHQWQWQSLSLLFFSAPKFFPALQRTANNSTPCVQMTDLVLVMLGPACSHSTGNSSRKLTTQTIASCSAVRMTRQLIPAAVRPCSSQRDGPPCLWTLPRFSRSGPVWKKRRSLSTPSLTFRPGSSCSPTLPTYSKSNAWIWLMPCRSLYPGSVLGRTLTIFHHLHSTCSGLFRCSECSFCQKCCHY